jgi:predicted amidohydrolase
VKEWQSLTIGLVQMRCEKGALEENLAAIHASLRAGAARGADIMCFPEMSITGYINPQQSPEAVLRLDGPEIARFVHMTSDMPVTAIAGFVEANPRGKPFITQVAACAGAILGVYRKRTIAEDEVEWFAPGSAGEVFRHPKVVFGISICADIDTPELFSAYANQGARIVFEAAAPGLYGAQETRDWRAGYQWWRDECYHKLGQYARDNAISIAVATQAGRTRDEDFPGGGYIFGPDGKCLIETPDWSEGVIYAEIPVA